MILETIVGHGRVVDLLRREVTRPANSYLFVGASGIGKATVARGFAQLLLCPVDGAHDEACRSCRRIETGNHPDLIEVSIEGRQSIGTDQARTIVQAANMTPVESPVKVFLVPEAGMLTEQAANVLLKTLEEPTSTTIFLLVAEAEDDLPSTVNSRCRTIHMGRVPDATIEPALIALGVDPERATALARVSGGRPGMALNLVGDQDVDGFRLLWLGLPTRFTGRPGEAALLVDEVEAWIEPLVQKSADVVGDELTKDQTEKAKRRIRAALMESGLEILATWYADSAAIQYGAPLRNADLPVADLTLVSPKRAVANTELILDAVADLNANLRPALLLTNLFTSLGSETA